MTFTSFTPQYYGNIIKNTTLNLGVDYYYCYVADGITKDAVSNTNPKTVLDEQLTIRQIMYGKRILPENSILMIRRVNWVNGTVYDAYNSRDPRLDEKNFYVMTSNQRVYKCLDNNKGAVSTSEPTFIDPLPTMTSDGYMWKYMYSITDNQMSRYSSQRFIPAFESQFAPVKGTVSSIIINSPGQYLNSNDGSILSVVTTTTFRIADNASSVSQYYVGNSVYITTGPAQGNLRRIINSYADTTGKYIVVDNPIPTLISGSQYSIAPSIEITGDGNGARARCIMNGLLIDRIEIIDFGHDYTWADGKVVSNINYSTEAKILINLSPLKGHASDVRSELYAYYALLHIDLDDILDDFPQNDITFAKIGILRNMKLESDGVSPYTDDSFISMAEIDVTYNVDSFSAGDTVYLEGNQNVAARVVYASAGKLWVVYKQDVMFNQFQVLNNGTSVTATITQIVNPEVKISTSDILAIINTDTITRGEDSREIVQYLIKVKS